MNTDDESVAFRRHWDITYKSTGKSMLVDSNLSEDALTMTTIMIWDSQASFDEAMADPVVITKWAIRKQYNIANGIVLSDRIVETT